MEKQGMKVQLLEGETLIMSSDNDQLVLTNLRVCYWRQNAYSSMTLDSIAFVGVGQQEQQWFLLLAVLSLLGLGVNAVLPIISFIVFLVLYFVSRQTQMQIQSASGKSIAVGLKGMKINGCVEFLNEVEAAKMRHMKSALGNH